jgi:RND family efflux transporter MFP subunit
LFQVIEVGKMLKFIKTKFNRRKLFFTGLITIILIGVAGFFYFGNKTNAAEFTTAKIERGNVRNTVSSTGTLKAVSTVTIGSQASGTISAIYADFNSTVKKGQVIAQLDPSTVQAQVTQAGANVRQVRANVENLRVGVDQARADYQKSLAALQQARAGVTTAQAGTFAAKSTVQNNQSGVISAEANVSVMKAEMDNAQVVLNQDQSLASKGVISQRELQTSQTAFKTAQARYEQAIAQLNQAKLSQQSSSNSGVVQSNAAVQQAQAQVKQAEAQVQQSLAGIKQAETQVQEGQAQIEQAEASLKLAEINQNNLTIISPIDGVVVSRDVEIGQTVAASLSAPTLFTIANDLTQMQVIASVDQADIALVEKSKKVNFTVDAFVGDEFSGTVNQIRLNPTTTQNVVTYSVVIDVGNPDLKLKPGMTANLEFTIDERSDVLKVPNSALRFTPPATTSGNVNRTANSNRQGSRRSQQQPENSNSAAPVANANNDQASSNANVSERPTPATEAVQAGQTRIVWVLNADKQLERRRIKIGLTDGTSTEFVDGNLQEGETIVTGQISTSSNPATRTGGQTAPGFGGSTGGTRGGGGGGRRQ